MKPQLLMCCKGWIQGLFPDHRQALAGLLSHADAQVFSTLPEPLSFNRELLYADLLDAVHPSWIAPFLRTLPSVEISLFLGALLPHQAQVLAEVLGFSEQVGAPTRIAKEALRQILRAQMHDNMELLPRAFLPQSPFNALLELSETKCKRLVRFLGLHDLSVEMRQIIATGELRRIFSALTKKEGKYLSSILIHREPLVFQRLFLDKWDGTKSQLHELLDTRGLNRLAQAVYQQSESFIWYLTRKLDMQQGALLLKSRKKPNHARGEQILQEQVESILEEAL